MSGCACASGRRPQEVSDRGTASASGANNALLEAVFPFMGNESDVRLAEHMWQRLDEWFTLMRHHGQICTNCRAKLSIQIGVVPASV